MEHGKITSLAASMKQISEPVRFFWPFLVDSFVLSATVYAQITTV